ncbi:MAG: response regulator [Clostridiales bacterium]|nr:response regulator [Clostridiales bacterium]
MKAFFKRIIDNYLFSDELPLRTRLANLICILGIAGAGVAAIIKAVEGIPLFATLLISGALVVGVTLYVLLTKCKRNDWGIVCLIFSATDLLIPITFIWGGGIKGALPIYFALGIVLHFLVFRKKTLAVMLTLNLLIFLGCIGFSAYFPQHIYILEPDWVYYLDNIQGVLINGLFIGAIITFQIWMYDRERKKSETLAKVKSEFLANMSHEIRTPMNAIIGMLAIADATDDPAKIRDALRKIDGASVHLLGIINDILDMSKLDADKLTLNAEPFSLRAVIDRVASIVVVEMNAKKQRFSAEIDGSIPDGLTGDAVRYAQVLTNLLNNAMKFTPEGGAVSLNVRAVSAENGRYTIACDVADTGIGIGPAQQARLFHAFEQAESTTTRKYGGTGLGLTISKRIAVLLGGDLTVSSVPGEGSVFTLTAQFGACPAPVPEDGSPAAAEDVYVEDDFGGHTILLAEDVDINREIVAALLEPTAIEIDYAENGAVAVQMYAAAPEKYDLIFMDIQMPVLDGYDATRQIRALDIPAAKKVPIVAMSANVFADDVKKSMDSGMNAHIGKPIDIDEVKGALRKYL